MRWIILGIVLLVCVPVAGVAYYRVGWDRMTDTCASRIEQQLDQQTDRAGVSFHWELPGGFTCKFSNGSTQQSWWF